MNETAFTFAELHGIPYVPEQGNQAAFTGKYISTLAELQGRRIHDYRQHLAEDSVTAHGATLDGAVMFIDIGAFTSRSKELTLGQINFWTNRFYNRLWPLCEQNHATLDKTLGDAILLVFSPRLGCETPLSSAIKVALASLELDHFGYRPHVGIASGQFWLGYSGPPAALSLTVLGGVVNLAARLGSKADELEICLTQNAWKSVAEQLQLGDHFSIHEFSANLKGIGETPCVKLRCNLKWYPQCAFKTVLT